MDLLTDVLTTQLTNAVTLVLSASAGEYEQHLVWRRGPNTSDRFSGYQELKPAYWRGVIALREVIKQFSDPIEAPWTAAYPRFARGDVFACPSTGGGLPLRVPEILTALTSCVLERMNSAVPVDLAIASSVMQFREELDSASVEILCLAPIVGLQVTEPSLGEIRIDDRLSIGRLSEDEYQRLYGGLLGFTNDTSFTSGFAFRTVVKARLGFSDQPDPKPGENEPDPADVVRSCLRDLAVFREGKLNYQLVQLSTRVPSAFARGKIAYRGRDTWPRSPYVIGSDDLEALDKHFKRMRQWMAPALATARNRLSDAELRHDPQDALSDSVIGLEALLAGDGEREGLRLKFALNYSVLADYSQSEERLKRFREAYDLYGIRSKVFHGSEGGTKDYQLGNVKVPLDQVAKRSREMLRETLQSLLRLDIPKKNQQDFWRQFWPDRYFGTGELPTPHAKTPVSS